MTQTIVTAEEIATPSREAAASSLLQRVILPRSGDPMSVRSLYMDERTGIRLTTAARAGWSAARPEGGPHRIGDGRRRLRVISRTSPMVPEQSEVSFGAYFNAFAAGYWRRWSRLTEVHLRLESSRAPGRVDVYRTKADGSQIFVRGVVITGPGRQDLDLDLDLRPFEDGGWYWFDLTTDTSELTLHAGGWYAAEEADRPGRRHDRHADVQPAGGLRRHPHRHRRGPDRARGRHRGDPGRPGHQEGA